MPSCHAQFHDEIAEEKYIDWEEGYIYSYYVLKATIMNTISHLIRLYKSTLQFDDNIWKVHYMGRILEQLHI